MEPEATLQEVSVRCYTEKPLFSQWTGQKGVLFCKEERRDLSLVLSYLNGAI